MHQQNHFLFISLSLTYILSLFLSRRTVCVFSSSFHLIISIRIMTFHVFLIKITSKNDASERTRRWYTRNFWCRRHAHTVEKCFGDTAPWMLLDSKWTNFYSVFFVCVAFHFCVFHCLFAISFWLLFSFLLLLVQIAISYYVPISRATFSHTPSSTAVAMCVHCAFANITYIPI